jgi:hypothetical protein
MKCDLHVLLASFDNPYHMEINGLDEWKEIPTKK